LKRNIYEFTELLSLLLSVDPLMKLESCAQFSLKKACHVLN